jgi:hypothetical protein
MARAAKSTEQFEAELASVDASIELAGPYVSARTKVACHCRVCGGRWEATPNHLLRGSGCPTCAGTARLDPAAFAARVAAASPEVELLGPYRGARERVACRCKVCGHEWSPYPRGLLQGNACPACARRAASERLALSHRAQG